MKLTLLVLWVAGLLAVGSGTTAIAAGNASRPVSSKPPARLGQGTTGGGDLAPAHGTFRYTLT
jgi:hypothetical protein